MKKTEQFLITEFWIVKLMSETILLSLIINVWNIKDTQFFILKDLKSKGLKMNLFFVKKCPFIF